jgi:predicted adenine nucleotide alpha hydrolase (AANH) superfamily ATPase
VYPVGLLRGECIEPVGLFFNPNIHPMDEYGRRMDTVRQYSGLSGMQVVYLDGFLQQTWEDYRGEELERCAMCYALRLDRAARYARENGFDAFTTSLLVSPYQKHELIRETGERMGREHGVTFYYRDFRPGFREGQQEAKEMGLYRQKHCGCIVSYRERVRLLADKEARKSQNKREPE